MKLLALFLSLLLLCPLAISAAPTPPMAIPVTTFDGLGHICPVGPNVAYTARHIAFYEYGRAPEDRAAITVRWAIPGSYKGGKADVDNFLWSLDVARMKSDTPFPFYYSVSTVDPKIGDEVTLVGYDFDDDAKQIITKGKIVRFGAGIMYFSRTPGPGSSGSCVFNKDGDVVAINFGGITKSNGSAMGVAAILSPDVLEILNKEKSK